MAPMGFRLGNFIVEPGTDRLAAVDGSGRTDLEPKTMAVLLALAEQPGRVVSSEELIHAVWHDRPMGENPVYKSIAKLRRALHDEVGESHYIETIPRKGYRLLVEPQPLPPPSPARRWRQVAGLAVLTLAGTGALLAGYGLHARPPEASEVNRGAAARLAAMPLETRQLYLLARAELRERRPGFADRMRRDAERVIAAAPDFAPGHALRAVACSFRVVDAHEPTAAEQVPAPTEVAEASGCARSSSGRALQLDPGSAEARAAAGFFSWVESRQCRAPCDERSLVDAAQAELEFAVRLDPSLPEAHLWLALLYQEHGDPAGAAAQAEAAVALDPLDPTATCNANRFLMARGERARVRERLVALTEGPSVPPCVYAQLVENAIATGDQDEAQRWARLLPGERAGRDALSSAPAHGPPTKLAGLAP